MTNMIIISDEQMNAINTARETHGEQKIASVNKLQNFIDNLIDDYISESPKRIPSLKEI